jgi:16S rRNA G966 N2-methylase RsmD
MAGKKKTDVATVPSVESEAYGKLKEDVFISGFTFERAMPTLKWLLQGDRWEHCGRFVDVNAFVASIGFDKLQKTAEERKDIAKMIKALQPKASNRAIAKGLGVSNKTVNRDLGTNVPPELEKHNKNNKAKVDGGTNVPPPPLLGSASAKLVQRQEKQIASQQTAEQRRQDSRAALPIIDGMELRIGDCRKVFADVPDNSVPLVLTDPPYPAEAEPLYRWLAEWSARVLIPGGSLICYTGHWSINRDCAIFDKHLRYWWIMAMMHDQSRRLPGKFIIAEFKPVLWYVKEFRRGKSLIPDVLLPPSRDKDAHDWGQGEGGVTNLFEHLTEPGETILDPFAGTATWGRIAVSMGRRWIGADIVDGGHASVEAAE